ncbi:MAG TPA: helix-turn-helix domain-containing protein [Acidimicrobiales bacterium]|nr:helix-turn-helix domain-containing protein [Acidimicrobiales bacterium]
MAAPAVEILRWPAHAGRREDLVAAQRPCLWVLETGELPPAIGPLEDWAREGDSERDVHARVQRLAALAPDVRALVPREAQVGEDGLLRFRGHLIAVPPSEARLLDRLAETPGTIVGRDELGRLLWDRPPASRSSLTSRIHTLRKRLRPVGLTIHAIRGHGFLLTAEAPVADGPSGGRRGAVEAPSSDPSTIDPATGTR